MKKLKTYKDVYELPLVMWSKDYYSRVYDSRDNFVFQFNFYDNYEQAKKIIDAINNDKFLVNKDISFYHKEGSIMYKSPKNKEDIDIILIRGWGNLTGTGAMSLSHEEAANIQDTFAEFIVNQLNKRQK